MAAERHVLDRLYEVVLDRIRERPEGSYVASLVSGGAESVGAKIREEAEELIEAANGRDPAHTAHEAADLLFHAWVLLGTAGVEPRAIWDELERRFGIGGLEEKAARPRRSPAGGEPAC